MAKHRQAAEDVAKRLFDVEEGGKRAAGPDLLIQD